MCSEESNIDSDTNNNKFLSLPTAIFLHEPGLASTRMSTFLDFTRDKDDGGGGDNWSYKTCKAQVISSPPTNQHPTFCRPDVLPVAQPTVSQQHISRLKKLKKIFKSLFTAKNFACIG